MALFGEASSGKVMHVQAWRGNQGEAGRGMVGCGGVSYGLVRHGRA